MGNKHSPPERIEPPTPLHVFRGFDGVPDEYSIPEVAEKRKSTDIIFLYIFFGMIWLLICLATYTLNNSDIHRFGGYDTCGNVCGEKNPVVEGVNCSGKDYTTKKILLYTEEYDTDDLPDLKTEPRECVDHCNKNYIQYLNNCFKVTDDNDSAIMISIQEHPILTNAHTASGYLWAMVFISIATCFFILIFFKYFLTIAVYAILISVGLLSFGFTIFLWTAPSQDRNPLKWFFLILVVFIVLQMTLLRRKLNLVLRVFNEATKAIFALSFIMLIPVLVFLIEIILLYIFFIALVFMFSAGKLTLLEDGYYYYVPDCLMTFTIFYTIAMYFYLCAFLKGCQQVIIAGAVSTWYFTREKGKVFGSPIRESFGNLRRSHVGSVAFGSLIIFLMWLLRAILRAMMKKEKFFLFKFIIDRFSVMVEYISNQSYIMMAMHGKPFIASGKRAAKLLLDNPLNTLSINSIGDCILWLTKIFVVIFTLICGAILDDGQVNNYSEVLLAGGVLAYFIAHNVFMAFETCVDTLHLCYCEDVSIHDGIEDPYYAPVELVAVMDEAKNIVESEKMYNSTVNDAIPPQAFV